MKIRKPIFAFLILLVLTAILAGAIFIICFTENDKQSSRRNELAAENVVQALKMIEKEINQLLESTKKRTDDGIDLTVSVLKTLVQGNDYSGLRIFDDGVVLQIVNDQIIYPEDFPWYFQIGENKMMDAETLRKGLSLESVYLIRNDFDEYKATAITTKKITDDYWYVDMTSEEEYNEMLEDEQMIFEGIADLQKTLGGYIFLIDNMSSNLSIAYAPPEFAEITSATEIGITKEDIDAKTPLYSINNNSYSASYTSLRMFKTPLTAVILINSTNELVKILNNMGLVLLLILLTVTAMILWIYWIQTYVRDHEISENQKKDYHPGQVRRGTRSVGLVGVFVFFFIAAALESLGNLTLESQRNNQILDLINDRMNSNTAMVSRFRDDEETWAVYYGQRLGFLFAHYPELQTTQFLSEANELLNYEYIMLFNEKGKEILSSNGYIGMDMKTDLVHSGNYFKWLFQGVSSVILDPEPDLITGKDIQLIGVPVYISESEIAGALIIGIDPEKSWQAAENENYSSFLNMITPSGNLAIIVDQKTGRVAYNNDDEDDSLENKLAHEVGLYEGDAPDTELDSFKINTNQTVMNYYGAYQKDGTYQYYYMTYYEVFQKSVLPFGLTTAIGFLIIYWITTSFMLHPYRSDVFNKTVLISNSSLEDSIFDESVNTEWFKIHGDDDNSENLMVIWRKMTPEKKASAFVQIALSLILITTAIRVLDPNSVAARSSIGFILQGSWRRGINLLAFAGILILIISFIIFILFKNLLMNVASNVLDRKAETVFRLVFSFIQYAAIIALLYFAFNFLGFDTRALLASVSLLSLAVSLGARDLVADILAGIFIIFEDDFHVGDIIDVNGFSGIVQEIGVRSTKLIGIGDNIKILGNQSVKNILNMSKMNSWYSVDLKISADQPLDEIEAMLKKELPEIGKSIPEIIGGPYYKGVMQIGSINTLYIIAECKQENYRRVQRKLNHAILDLFNEHGYKLS